MTEEYHERLVSLSKSSFEVMNDAGAVVIVSESNGTATPSFDSMDEFDTATVVVDTEAELYRNEPPLKDHAPEGYSMNNRVQTLRELKMCEASKGGPKGRALKCEKDPSCIECVPKKFLERAQSAIDAFKDETLRKERRKKIREWFPDTTTIILIATDRHFVKYLLNFVCTSKYRNFNVASKLLVVATDIETYNIAVSKNLKVAKPSFYNLTMPLQSAFLDTMVAVTAAAAEITQMGYNVCIQDADVTWFRNPLWLFAQPSLASVDLMFQLAPRWDAQGVANTGFILARATERTKTFLSSLLHISSLYYWARDDQVIWNSLLRHWTFSQLHWQTLPRRLKIAGANGGGRYMDLHTGNGFDGTARWIDNKTVIVHTVAGDSKVFTS